MNVKGKNILITGGAGGLGRVMAETLAKNGANICILDLPSMEEQAAGQIRELRGLGVKARYIGMDGTKEEDWKNAVETLCADTDHIDVLCNNAGINIRKPVMEMSMDEWMTMMCVNTGSLFLGVKYLLPVFIRQRDGVFINTSSVCGLIGHRYTPEAYTATKGAVTLFTKAIAARYGKYNVRSNSIHPSTVDTPLIHERLRDPEFAAERLGEVPLGRLADAQDVANAVLYLASEEAKFLNGVSLPVDGGVTCC